MGFHLQRLHIYFLTKQDPAIHKHIFTFDSYGLEVVRNFQIDIKYWQKISKSTDDSLTASAGAARGLDASLGSAMYIEHRHNYVFAVGGEK